MQGVHRIGLIGILSFLAIGAFAADDDGYLNGIRKGLGVHAFASPDYAATFAIIAGVSIILIIAVIFIVVGLMTMDPGKDSIIYRMTTARMKKD